MSYIVLRMFEKTEVHDDPESQTCVDLHATSPSQVNVHDPERYRIEMTFSRGADLSPLEVITKQFTVYFHGHVAFAVMSSSL